MGSRGKVWPVDDMSLGLSIVVAVAMIGASVAIWLVTARAAAGLIGRNRFAGIRTLAHWRPTKHGWPDTKLPSQLSG